jgi:hypothetical protein
MMQFWPSISPGFFRSPKKSGPDVIRVPMVVIVLAT